LKVSIGHRLFSAVLLSFLAVAAIGVELVRWRMSDSFSQSVPNTELEHVGGLVSLISAQYRQHHDWSFLPADGTARKTWLREALLRSQQDQQATPGASSSSPSLAYRIGLLDPDRHYLAGAVASAALIAVASIDTIQRALVVDGKTVGYLVLAKSQNPDDELAVAFLVEQQRNLFVIAAIGVLLSALAAALLAAHFRRPVRQLVEGARRLGKAQFDTRMNISRSDELGELADTFNQLAAKLEDTERSRQQWVANTSHELRTPLSVLRGQMEALQDGIRTATPENIALMLRQVLSLTKLVDELHELARAEVGQLPYHMAANDAWQPVQNLWDGFSEKFRLAGLTATMGAPPARSIVRCDVDRIGQVVTNLLENSVRYTAPGGRIQIIGAVIGHELHIVIEDSAPGVPVSSLDRLGERFFRVEASRNRQFGGAGLGLALSRQILEVHAGRLEFGPSPLGGLRATIILKLEG
jgi:two-component system, OmpR family, sensor histidine kinase BaeS